MKIPNNPFLGIGAITSAPPAMNLSHIRKTYGLVDTLDTYFASGILDQTIYRKPKIRTAIIKEQRLVPSPFVYPLSSPLFPASLRPLCIYRPSQSI
jgi:hypothetical protein